MNPANQIWPLAAVALSVISLAGCVPMDRVARPTLDEVRSGNARGQVTEDTRLHLGEIQGAIDRIDRGGWEILEVGYVRLSTDSASGSKLMGHRSEKDGCSDFPVS